jgi:hypothetical protein
MTSNQTHLQSATIDLLKHLKSRKETVQARQIAELAEIDREIEAVSITLRLLRETAEGSDFVETVKPSVIPDGLAGKSAREACIEIAKRNNGFVRIADARNALVSAGILKSSKNTWAIVYTTLQRSKEFEKAGSTGVFRLIGAPGSPESQATLL